MPAVAKTLTVRLPAELHRQTQIIARRHEISFNALVQGALAAVAKKEAEAELYDAFGRLGEDADECDVEFAAAAQWEVVTRGESNSAKRPRQRSAKTRAR